MSLLLYGKLPQWYIEHITIPLPDIAAIHKSIDRSGTMLHFERYQACLNLLAYCVQQMIPHWRAERLGEQIAPLVHRLDVVGARTSGLFVANRAGLGGH